MKFGEQILFARAKLNLTQSELGEKLHVSAVTVCRWETDKVAPTKKARMAFEQLCNDNNITFVEESK